MDDEKMYGVETYDAESDNDGFNLKNSLNKKANRLIKTFSGSEFKVHKKMIDNLITFTGLAGGVGTSTIVANLASFAEKKDISVVVVDTNIEYPIQYNYFGIRQQIKKNDLVNYLNGSSKLGDCIDYKGEVGLIFPNNRNLVDLVNCDGGDAAGNFSKMLSDLSDLFDLVLVDCSNRVENDIVNMALYKADVIYAVFDENISCLSNIERLRNNLQITGITTNKIKTIMNKRTNIHYSKTILKGFDIEPVDILPFDTAVIESGLRGEIFCNKGASNRETASQFVCRMEVLMDKILENGGYRRG